MKILQIRKHELKDSLSINEIETIDTGYRYYY
jgi:hypothetical protein